MATDNFKSNVPAMKAAFADWQEKALKAIGMYIEGQAVLRCPVAPVRGGNLVGSIRHIVDNSARTVTIGTPVDYAIYVEKGTGRYAVKGDGRKTAWYYEDDFGVGHWTRGHKPQPFLTPAAEDNIKNIRDIVRKVKFANGTN